VSVLDQLEEWVRSNEEELRRVGISSSFERGPRTDKSAAWINLEGNGWIGHSIAWESGEIELLARREEAEEEAMNEYHQVHESSEVLALLDRLAEVVMPRSV
jgi:hypothetical protein